MANLIDFSSRDIVSDAPGPVRAPGTRAIGHWLVYVSATLWRLSDVLARVSPHCPTLARRRGPSATTEDPLLTHPDPDVRLLAALAQEVGEAATTLSPDTEPDDDLDPDLIPF